MGIDGPAARADCWQRITGVYCSAARSAKLFVDGVAAGAKAVLANTRTAYQPNTRRPLRLGAGGSESATAKFPFQGELKAIRVYSRAIPAEEVPLLGGEADPPVAKGRGAELRRSKPNFHGHIVAWSKQIGI